MKVFLFDLIPYGAHFEDAKANKFLPYPLPGDHYDREVAARYDNAEPGRQDQSASTASA